MREKSLLILTRQFHQGVEDELIGENVRVVRITDAIRKKIAEDNTHQIANWDLYYGGYDHAFVNTYNPSQKDDNEAEQEIVRAIVILKIIQPFSSGLHLVLFAFIYPAQRKVIPRDVLSDLISRFINDEQDKPGTEQICNGTLLSRREYRYDVIVKGLQDARLNNRCRISPEELNIWDNASHEMP